MAPTAKACSQIQSQSQSSFASTAHSVPFAYSPRSFDVGKCSGITWLHNRLKICLSVIKTINKFTFTYPAPAPRRNIL